MGARGPEAVKAKGKGDRRLGPGRHSLEKAALPLELGADLLDREQLSLMVLNQGSEGGSHLWSYLATVKSKDFEVSVNT